MKSMGSIQKIHMLSLMAIFFVVQLKPCLGAELSKKPGFSTQPHVSPTVIKQKTPAAPVVKPAKKPVRNPLRRAKKKVLPDFVVSSLSLSPPTVSAGQKSRLTIALANKSSSGPHTVLVRCRQGNKTLATKRTVIQAGQQQHLNMMVQPAGTGRQALAIVVDADRRIHESNEQNNTTTTHITVNPPPLHGGRHKKQLAAKPTVGVVPKDGTTRVTHGLQAHLRSDLIPVSLQTLKKDIMAGDRVILKATIRNAGTTSFTDVPVALYGDGLRLLSQKMSFAANTVKTTIFKLPVKEAGPHRLQLKVDPENSVAERNELNNALTMTLHVNARSVKGKIAQQGGVQGASTRQLLSPRPMPTSVTPGQPVKPTAAITNTSDLYVQTIKWSAMPMEGAEIGTSAIATLTVINNGPAKSSTTTMEITPSQVPDGTSSTDMSAFTMTVQIPELLPGHSYNVSWPAVSGGQWRSGSYLLHTAIQFDPAGESNEMNNIRFFDLQVKDGFKVEKVSDGLSVAETDSDPELLIPKADLTGSLLMASWEMAVGQEYTIGGLVTNGGNLVSQPSMVHIHFTNTNGTSAIFFAKTAVGALLPGWSEHFTLTGTVHSTTFDYSKIRVLVDAEKVVDEADESNNMTSYPVTVETGAEPGKQLELSDTATENLTMAAGTAAQGVEIDKPDLVASILPMENPMYLGNVYTFRGVVTNKATAPSTPGSASFYFVSKDKLKTKLLGFADFPALGRHHGIQVQTKVTLVDPDFDYDRIGITADVNQEVDEINEGNNITLYPVTVVQPPSLTEQLQQTQATAPELEEQEKEASGSGVMDIVATAKKPDLVATLTPVDGPLLFGKEHTFKGLIENVGTDVAAESWAQLVVQNESGTTFRPQKKFRVQELGSGAGVNVTLTGIAPVEHADSVSKFVLWADVEREVAELNESNNASAQLAVEHPSWPEGQE